MKSPQEELGITPPGRRLIRLSEVLKIYPVSRSTWYEGVKAGAYPQSIPLSRRAVGWWEDEVIRVAEIRAQSRSLYRGARIAKNGADVQEAG